MNYSAIQLWCDPVFIRRRIIEQTRFYAEVASRPLEGEFTAKRKKWVLSAALLQLWKFQDRYDSLMKNMGAGQTGYLEVMMPIPDTKPLWLTIFDNLKRRLVLITL